MLKRGLFIVACTFVVAACGNKGGDSGNGNGGAPTGQVATTALDASCLNGMSTPTAACNGAMYNQYNQYGFRTYGAQYMQWQNTGGYYQYYYQNFSPQQYGITGQAAFCQCPTGHRPVYTTTQGLGCVRDSVLNRFGAVVYYSMDSNNQFVLAGLVQANMQNQTYANNPRMRYMERAGYYRMRNKNRSMCYQHVAQACQINIPSCAAGTQCIPAGDGSQLGICATGLNNGYAQQGNGQYGCNSTGCISR